MDSSIEITPELMAGFLDEATEHLGIMTTHLLSFEQAAESGPLTFDVPENQQRMTELFRSAHSLKGLSGAFGFLDINRLTHTLETLCDEARNQKRALDLPALNALLQAVTHVEQLVGALQTPGQDPPTIDDVMQQLQSILTGQTPPPTPTTGPNPTVPADPPAAAAPAEPTAAPAGVNLSAVPDSVLADPELRKAFLEATDESVGELNRMLLALEQGVTTDLVNEVFRVAHSLKGACGAAGLHDATALTHRMESLFERIRAGQAQLTEHSMAALLKAADRLADVVEQVRSDRYAAWTEDQIAALFAMPVDAAASSATHDPVAHATSVREDAAAQRFEAEIPTDVLNRAGSGYRIAASFRSDDPERELQAYLVLNKIRSLGDLVWMQPDLDAGGLGDAKRVDFVMRNAEFGAAADLQQFLRSFAIEDVQVEAIASATPGAAAPPARMASNARADSDPPGSVPSNPAPRTAAARPDAAAPTAASAAPDVVSEPNRPSPPTAPPPSRDTDAPAARPAAQPAGAATIRVEVERLDQLMNLGGELVINRARFAQMAREFKTVFEGKDVGYVADDVAEQLAQTAAEAKALAVRRPELGPLGERLDALCGEFELLRQVVQRVRDAKPTMHNLEEAVNTLERISDGLQKRIMDTRMVPVGPLFQRFARLTRDLARDLGKKINFVTSGENTELDKKMIDELADPLTHLVRNSADHGIEAADERTASGKPAAATITLAAYHQGNNICIEVRDDGRGINVARIRDKIRERGLATDAQLAQMSEQELVQYIFHPGFSTARQVSDLSGRGMGMDIVKTKIAALNGTVEVSTQLERGTVITIRLPLTLAIIHALQTGIGSEVYAIPLESVAEIVTLKRTAICSVQGRSMVRVRDTVIPIYLLEDLLDVRAKALRTAGREADEWTIVIIADGAARAGLVVDRLLGQDDIVIKSLAENYRNVPGFSGATIMGDGRVSLILDVAHVMNVRKAVRDASNADPAGGQAA